MPAAITRQRTKQVPKTAPKTEFIRARIDPDTKAEAEAVLNAIGLTLTDAFRLMTKRIVAERKLPFQPLVPNEATIAALRADIGGRVIHVGSPDDLWAAIDDDPST